MKRALVTSAGAGDSRRVRQLPPHRLAHQQPGHPFHHDVHVARTLIGSTHAPA